MAKPDPRVRPETLALGALIEAAVEQAVEAGATTRQDGLLFLGNRHAAFPLLVVRDPILEPVDKLVWMTIFLQAQATSGYTAFPSYDYIRGIANIASKSTVARAIAILRATRWLTLCARIREHNGRFRGNVFTLHDQPLPLADVLHLDSSYMAFLQQVRQHLHPRVRLVANGVLTSLDEAIGAGADACDEAHPAHCRIEAEKMVANEGRGDFFAFSAKAIEALRDSSVSDTDEIAVEKIRGKEGIPLIYPGRLDANQRALAALYLEKVQPEQRQLLLDELQGRFHSEAKGMPPLYDALRFLNSLCKAIHKGRFMPNLGIPVTAERLAEQKRRKASATPKSASQPEADHAVGMEALSRMRASLGRPDRSSRNLIEER